VRSRKPALPRLLPIDPRFFSAFPRLEKKGKKCKINLKIAASTAVVIVAVVSPDCELVMAQFESWFGFRFEFTWARAASKWGLVIDCRSRQWQGAAIGVKL